jgi:hypothetical protein
MVAYGARERKRDDSHVSFWLGHMSEEMFH